MQMYASEILVPSLNEIKGNKRKSQANVQENSTYFSHFS